MLSRILDRLCFAPVGVTLLSPGVAVVKQAFGYLVIRPYIDFLSLLLWLQIVHSKHRTSTYRLRVQYFPLCSCAKEGMMQMSKSLM